MDDIALHNEKRFPVTLKRTSTQRSDCNCSDLTSPSVKRLRNSRCTENKGEEVQEVFEEVVEVLTALELDLMTDLMAEKFDEILARLNKVDSIETILNNLCSKMTIVEGDISKLKADADVTDDKL